MVFLPVGVQLFGVVDIITSIKLNHKSNSRRNDIPYSSKDCVLAVLVKLEVQYRKGPLHLCWGHLQHQWSYMPFVL